LVNKILNPVISRTNGLGSVKALIEKIARSPGDFLVSHDGILADSLTAMASLLYDVPLISSISLSSS